VQEVQEVIARVSASVSTFSSPDGVGVEDGFNGGLLESGVVAEQSAADEVEKGTCEKTAVFLGTFNKKTYLCTA